MPERIDPFVIVRLLRSLTLSDLVKLNPEQKTNIQEEIKRIEESCFDPSKQQIDESDLKNTASKWLKLSC
jgi:hypothetical protein